MRSSKNNWILSSLSFLLLLILWELSAKFSGWNEHVFPGPLQVLKGMMELSSDGTLFRHSVASLYRVTAGFYLAVVLGIPLGILMGRWSWMRMIVNPMIQFLRPISPLAWIPLAMLWFGIGDKPAIFLIFLSSFFPLVVSTTVAVGSINPVFFQVARNFNFSRWETISRIVVPAITPSVITALRITITIAWLVVVAAEMIAVQSGLGYLILDSRNALRMDYVMDGMIIIGFIGLLLDGFMRKLGHIEAALWRTMGRRVG
ncbi:MAG: ABC transporter permease [Desulfobacteraceae bacterium]|jgi:NitT/TauT family transport system permease protein|nr:ABC transporter permease [Desulfobacteraceae bacterium]